MQGEALANPALSKRTGANKNEKSPLLLPLLHLNSTSLIHLNSTNILGF
jgi:hypothetical protein